MVHCLVKSCKSEGTMPGISFHTILRRTDDRWLDTIRRIPRKNFPFNNVICSLHFKEKDFIVKTNRRYLKGSVVPSLYLTEPPPENSKTKPSPENSKIVLPPENAKTLPLSGRTETTPWPKNTKTVPLPANTKTTPSPKNTKSVSLSGNMEIAPSSANMLTAQLPEKRVLLFDENPQSLNKNATISNITPIEEDEFNSNREICVMLK